MVHRWDRFRNPWDREYARRGRLWRGSASIDPLPRMVRAPGPALEVGCGDGKFLTALASNGFEALGLDSSRNALRLIEPSAGRARIGGDARRLPVRDGSFPLVAARYLLAALRGPDRVTVATELVRVLKPRGFLLVEEFSMEDFRFGSGRELEPATFERNRGILTHYFGGEELRSLFVDLDVADATILRSTQRIGIRRAPRVSHRIVFRKPALPVRGGPGIPRATRAHREAPPRRGAASA